MDLRDIRESILQPLNEILLLSYGTDVYRQILVNIEHIINELEQQHKQNSQWQ